MRYAAANIFKELFERAGLFPAVILQSVLAPDFGFGSIVGSTSTGLLREYYLGFL
jgi:hypothetical protein